MTLDTYLGRDGAMSLTELSVEMGISKGRLSQLRTSLDWPPELAMKAEVATDGELNASELSPIVARARKTSPDQAAA